MKQKPNVRIFLGGTLAVLLLLILIWTAFIFDNKYFIRSPNIMSLSDNWEYCPGELYMPEDFHNPDLAISSELIYIGQFGDFSTYSGNSNPFGEATYRKVLHLENGDEKWLMMVPEIFSASEIYVNGERVAKHGSFSPYSLQTKNTIIPLPNGTVEIVIRSANHSHYYSGMIYPPLLGASSSIFHLVIMQLLIYGLLCFFSLGIAIASISLWKYKGKKLFHLFYGLLCLFFSIHVSYPFIHWLGFGTTEFPYILEDCSFYAMILCMVLLTTQLTKHRCLRRLHKLAAGIAGSMIVCSILFPYILFTLYPPIIIGYGYIVSVFKLYISVYLISASLYGIRRSTRNIWLLYGNMMFGIGVFADFITAGKYEPLRFGWMDEYSSFIMVIFFTVLVLKTNKELAADNERLTLNLQSEVEKKTAFLSKLLDERRSFLASAAHDLKAPASVIQTYIDYIRESNTELDEEMKEYLTVIDNKTNQIRENVRTLQLFNTEDRLQDPVILCDYRTFLTHVYEETLPYADANGIHFTLHLPEDSANIYIQKNRLFRALENLIINSTEHTPLNGHITLLATLEEEQLLIKVCDNGNGIQKEDIPYIFDYKFTTRAEDGGNGMGLYFTRITIEEGGGTIFVTSVPHKKTIFTIALRLS